MSTQLYFIFIALQDLERTRMAWLRSCIALIQEKYVTIGLLYNAIYY